MANNNLFLKSGAVNVQYVEKVIRSRGGYNKLRKVYKTRSASAIRRKIVSELSAKIEEKKREQVRALQTFEAREKVRAATAEIPPPSPTPKPTPEPLVIVQDETTQQTRALLPIEVEALKRTTGGQSVPVKGTFGQEGTEVFIKQDFQKKISPVTELPITKITKEKLSKAQEAKIAKEAEFERIMQEGSLEELKSFQAERAVQTKKKLLVTPPAFGKLDEPLEGGKVTVKRVGEQLVGTVSKGFEVIGTGAEGFLQDVKEREALKQRTLTGPKKVVSKVVEGSATFGGGIVRGGVTEVGTSPVTAGLMIGSAGVGAGVSVFKTFKLAKPLVTGGKATSAAVKGIKIGAVTGGVVAGAGIVATSETPLKTAGQVVGGTLAVSSAFKTGSVVGGKLSVKAKGFVQTQRAKDLSRQLAKKKSLTVVEERSLAKISKDVSLEVKGKPIKKIVVTQREVSREGAKKLVTKTRVVEGDLTPIDAKDLGKAVRLDIVAERKSFLQAPQSTSKKSVYPRLETFQKTRGSIIVSDKSFELGLVGKDHRITSIPTISGRSAITTSKATIVPSRTSLVSPKVSPVRTTISGGKTSLPGYRTKVENVFVKKGSELLSAEQRSLYKFTGGGRLLSQSRTPYISVTKIIVGKPIVKPVSTTVFPRTVVPKTAEKISSRVVPESRFGAVNIEKDVLVDVSSGELSPPLFQVQKVRTVSEAKTIGSSQFQAIASTGVNSSLTSSISGGGVSGVSSLKKPFFPSVKSPLSSVPKTSVIPRTIPKTGLKIVSPIVSKEAVDSSIVNITDTIPKTATLSKVSSISLVDTIPKTATLSDTSTKLASQSLSLSITSVVPKTTVFSRSKVSLRPKIYDPLIKPTFIIDDEDKKKKRKGLFGFIVRRAGKFETVGTGLSYKAAVKGLTTTLRETPRASGKVIRLSDKKAVKVTGAGASFRTGKKDPLLLVEKRGRRITTPGELRGITFKGIASQRRRRL